MKSSQFSLVVSCLVFAAHNETAVSPSELLRYLERICAELKLETDWEGNMDNWRI